MISYTKQKGNLGQYGQPERSISAQQLRDPDSRGPSAGHHLFRTLKGSNTGCNNDMSACECPLHVFSSPSPTSTQSTETLQSLNKFATDYCKSGVSVADINSSLVSHPGQTFLLDANRSGFLSNGITDIREQGDDEGLRQYETKRPVTFDISQNTTGGADELNQEEVRSSSWYEMGVAPSELLENAPVRTGYTLESTVGSQEYSSLTVSSREGLPHARYLTPQENFEYKPSSRPLEMELWPSICYECGDPNAVYANIDAWLAHLSTTKHHGIWPSFCYKCGDPNITYESLSVWLAHAWTQHPNTSSWLPCECLWMDPPCLSPKVFKTHKLWLDHVNGIHQKSFWCTVSDCELRQGGLHETAFGTQSYLKRHQEATHQTPIHCDKPFCSGRKSKLNRSDKREDHTKWHGPFFCGYGGCSRRRIEGHDYGFLSQELLEDHLRRGKHSPTKRRNFQEKKA